MIHLPDKLKSQNPKEYGIVDAIEVTGHKIVTSLQELTLIPDSILTNDSTGITALGLMWFVLEDNSIYRLISWLYRKQTYGWELIMKDGLWTSEVLNISLELGDSEGLLVSQKKITEEILKLQNEKLDITELTNLTIGLKPRGTTTNEDLPTTGDTIGAAYLVEDYDVVKYPYGVILAWSGTEWVNTGLTGFPVDVATKGGVDKTIKLLDDDIKLRTRFISFYNLSLERGNYSFVDKRSARIEVPESLRSNGQIVSYRLVTEEWVTEQFISSNVAAYLEDSNWEEIGKKIDGLVYDESNNQLWLTSDGEKYGNPVELPKGKGLLNVSNNTGLYNFPTPLDARNQVEEKDRERGLVITYLLLSGAWNLDIFVGDSEGSWGLETSWRTYATTSDLLVISNQMLELTSAVDIIESKIDTKGDGLDVDKIDNDTFLYLTSNGERVGDPILLPEGGGGSGSGIIMRVRVIGNTSIITGQGVDVFIKYTFSSIDSETSDDTGPGTYTISVNNTPISTGTAVQGENTFNLKNYINIGTNVVRVRVVDSYGNARTVTWNITSAALTISSTFADDTIYNTNPVLFRYTPIGIGEKTIRFWLDGVELSPDVTDSSGRQMTKTLPALNNGYHSLLVYAESSIEGSILKSNELYYEFIFANASATQPIISASFNKTEVTLFSIIEIPYMVYNPANPIALVTIRINGEVNSLLNVPRTKLIFSYSAYTLGALQIDFICGATVRTFHINVTASEFDITEELADLEYKVSAIGKSNSSSDRNTWNNNGYLALFTNFSWANDGWQKDSAGNNCLKLIGDNRVSINIRPFRTNILITGMTLTIEYSTVNVTDANAVVASCKILDGIGVLLTPSSVTLKSAQSTVTARLDSTEKTSITFVVQKLAENRLVYLFIDGIASGTLLYPATDNFTLNPLLDLVLSTGERSCNAQFYGIRWYTNSLNFDLVLGNFIFDIESLDDKMEVYAKNLVTNEYGEVDYNKALQFLPCMTFIGPLPRWKGDKVNTDIIYEDMLDSRNSFYALNAQSDVQGTSSQYYPIKNYKYKLKNGFTWTETGEHGTMYPLSREDNILPANVFCLKADFAESSGTHNTGMSIIIDEVLRSMNYRVPPLATDSKVRTTIYGFPIVLFHKTNTNDPAKFVGKYNFNTDKAAENTFGFTEGDECWEFKNNTSDRSLFKSANFVGTDWLNDFEGRYPDGYEDPTNLKKVFEWVVSCIGNPAKFKSECKNHFNVSWLVFYYLLTEVFGMVDQRAKNMMLTTYGERGDTGDLIWYFIFYDSDTCLGINNEGLISFDFNIEDLDVINSGHVWNGWDSELWKLVSESFSTEITSLYLVMRQLSALSVDTVLLVLLNRLAEEWCEMVYNRDGYYKYLGPLIDGYLDYSESHENPLVIKTGAYLYALQGSRSKHRVWWVTNRLRYMDSKYNAGTHLTDYATMRLYTPSSWTGVAPNFDFTLSIVKPGYNRVKYGSYQTEGIRTEAGGTYIINSPSSSFNDTETIIYGISGVKSMGNLASKYPGTVDISRATALEDLIIGSTVTGYKNTNLTVLHTGSNEKLRVINVANCPNLIQSLELSNCYSLLTIEARGSGITGFTLPLSGILQTVNLPATVSAIYLKNQPNLTTFTAEGYANINTIVLENVPSIDPYTFAKNTALVANSKLSKLRLIGIDSTDLNVAALNRFASMSGEDENGLPTELSVVTGKIHINQITQGALDRLSLIFPNLQITYSELLNVIDFLDNIIKGIMVTNFDTNGDGEVSTSEVNTKVVPSDMIPSNSGAISFNELHYWRGSSSSTKSVINDIPTLKSVSILTGRATLTNLPALDTVYIYPGPDESMDASPLLYSQQPLGNCYNIDKFFLSGRYLENSSKGAILGRINHPSGVFYQLCYPLKGYSYIKVDELCHYDDLYEATYGHGSSITTLEFNNLRGLSVGRLASLNTINVHGLGNGYADPVNITINANRKNLTNINIDGSVHPGRLGNITVMNPNDSGSLYITVGEGITSTPTNSTIRTIMTFLAGWQYSKITVLDLGTTVNSTIEIQVQTVSGQNLSAPIERLIIRNTSDILPLNQTGGAVYPNSRPTFANGIYVPDALVDSYKVATNWVRYAALIRPLSLLG